MCRKLFFLASFVLVLGLVGSASAALPPGWISEDIGNPAPGSASESGGTWTVTGNGHDIWDNSDNFHYVYQYLEGDGEMSARVLSNGTGSNNWAKGGVMIRETNDGGSKHVNEVVTAGEGAGLACQWRTTTGGGSAWTESTTPVVSPPYWVRIKRTGDLFEGFHSPDGVIWTKEGDITISMAQKVLIGLCVTSHAAGELRTFEFDNLSYVGDIAGQIYSSDPTPADGAILPQTYSTLSWTAGYSAVSHDIYFGENLADVEAGTGDTFRVNQGGTFYVAGVATYPYPDGLVNGTTYYWRVDEVEADGTTKHTGDVWSFTVPSKTAYAPVPGDGSKFVDPENLIMNWAPGYGAIWHTVYFGDDYDTVANATGEPPSGLATFNPGPLELDKTYYWRVDETAQDGFYTGDVWSFTTTLEGLGEVVMERWENIPGTDIPALTNSFKYPNNPDVTERLTSFSWDLDLETYGGRIHGWLYAPATGDYTFWLCTDDNGELWLSTDDDSTNVQLIAQESGWTAPNTWGSGEEQSEPVPLVAGQKYYIMALWKEEGGGDHCQVAWQGPGVPTRVIIPGSNLSPYEPLNAFGAKPSNNGTGVTQTPIFEWKAGLQAASHELYFGTDEDAVRNATKASPEYKGAKTLGDESYDPGKLLWETAYYWRIDEVNATNPASPWVGNVWNFTTADFLIIDDFEDYDAGDNQIWYSWIDGLGFGAPGTGTYNPGNGTGAAVGDETTASYTEEAIVHGGNKSMPLDYDNNKQGYSMYSETELTLIAARDWTEEGVANLSIWFRGYPVSTGSFVEGPVGTYTMTGSGWDIEGSADGFHYAYKMLTGAGSIVAKVESVENTNGWAKAGVMIRETLEPGSVHAMTVMTPEQGVSFQRRITTADVTSNTTTGGIVVPYWVKIERDIAGNFTASSSDNGSAWTMQGVFETIPMGANVYIGLALTSHDVTLTSQAVFSNVTITGNVTGQWAHQDIGITSNAAEPLYVAVSNSTGTSAVVVHDDPAAATIDTWTEWVIPLQTFADQGIVLTNVDRIAIGLGTRGNITIPGGSGKMFIDDIRLNRPAPEPEP